MSNKGSSPSNGKVPRAGTNKFPTVFAPRGKGTMVVALHAPAPDRLVHEKQSKLPITLVAGLVPPVAPLRAAGGDDDLMSQAPARNSPKANPLRATADGQ